MALAERKDDKAKKNDDHDEYLGRCQLPEVNARQGVAYHCRRNVRSELLVNELLKLSFA